MTIKNKELELMIKMENIIGMNEFKIFGENKDKTVKFDNYEISFDDFIDYMNLIQRLIEQRDKNNEKTWARIKAKRELDPTYARSYSQKENMKKNKEVE